MSRFLALKMRAAGSRLMGVDGLLRLTAETMFGGL
jgi:hypothetical protein